MVDEEQLGSIHHQRHKSPLLGEVGISFQWSEHHSSLSEKEREKEVRTMTQ